MGKTSKVKCPICGSENLSTITSTSVDFHNDVVESIEITIGCRTCGMKMTRTMSCNSQMQKANTLNAVAGKLQDDILWKLGNAYVGRNVKKLYVAGGLK